MCSSPFSIYFLKNDTRTKSGGGGGGGEAVWEQAAGAVSPHLTSSHQKKSKIEEHKKNKRGKNDIDRYRLNE